MRKLCIWCLVWISTLGYAQQLSLTVENDLLVFSDRNYTSGIFLEYEKMLSESFFLEKKEGQQLKLGLRLGHEIYAPEELDSFEKEELDRPFAGWLYTRLSLDKIKRNSRFSVGVDIGVTGNPSLAKDIHQWYHKLLSVDIPSYAYEIPFEILGNIRLEYAQELLHKNRFAVQSQTATVIGTKDIYGEQWILGTLNKRAFNFSESIRSKTITRERETLFTLGIGYRYIAHNTLLEGSLIYDKPALVKRALHHMFIGKLGMQWRREKNMFEIYANMNSREARSVKHHIYIGIKYIRGL